MSRFRTSTIESSVKVFLSLNFYGHRYDRIIPAPPKGERQFHKSHILGHGYIDFLKQYYTKAKITFDQRAREHVTFVHSDSTGNSNQQDQSSPEIIIFYPSLKSLYDRLELAAKLKVGAAIWDGGQGLDYFFDLF